MYYQSDFCLNSFGSTSIAEHIDINSSAVNLRFLLNILEIVSMGISVFCEMNVNLVPLLDIFSFIHSEAVNLNHLFTMFFSIEVIISYVF